MNNRTSLLYILAALLPLSISAHADELQIEKVLNGLDITTEIAGASSGGPGPGPGTSGGTQLMKVTNNTSDTVRCELKAGPAEPSDDTPGPVKIDPHESSALRLPGNYSSATFKGTLTCTKA